MLLGLEEVRRRPPSSLVSVGGHLILALGPAGGISDPIVGTTNISSISSPVLVVLSVTVCVCQSVSVLHSVTGLLLCVLYLEKAAKVHLLDIQPLT